MSSKSMWTYIQMYVYYNNQIYGFIGEGNFYFGYRLHSDGHIKITLLKPHNNPNNEKQNKVKMAGIAIRWWNFVNILGGNKVLGGGGT